MLGLDQPGQTVVHRQLDTPSAKADLLTHDARKYLTVLLSNNANVLEEIAAPDPLVSGPLHQELQQLAQACITQQHVRHYQGMARQMQSRFDAHVDSRLKAALHLYRIHLMNTGQVQTHLPTLNPEARIPMVDELTQQRQEQQDDTLTNPQAELCRREQQDLALKL